MLVVFFQNNLVKITLDEQNDQWFNSLLHLHNRHQFGLRMVLSKLPLKDLHGVHRDHMKNLIFLEMLDFQRLE